MSTVPQDTDGLEWRISSFSKNEPDCVEAAPLPDGGWKVRNSNDRRGPVVDYTDSEWTAFIAGVKAGEFD